MPSVLVTDSLLIQEQRHSAVSQLTAFLYLRLFSIHTHYQRQTQHCTRSQCKRSECKHKCTQISLPVSTKLCDKYSKLQSVIIIITASHETEAKAEEEEAAAPRLIASHLSCNPVERSQRPSGSQTHPAGAVLFAVGAATPHPGKASFQNTARRCRSPGNTARPHPV